MNHRVPAAAPEDARVPQKSLEFTLGDEKFVLPEGVAKIEPITGGIRFTRPDSLFSLPKGSNFCPPMGEESYSVEGDGVVVRISYYTESIADSYFSSLSEGEEVVTGDEETAEAANAVVEAAEEE